MKIDEKVPLAAISRTVNFRTEDGQGTSSSDVEPLNIRDEVEDYSFQVQNVPLMAIVFQLCVYVVFPLKKKTEKMWFPLLFLSDTFFNGKYRQIISTRYMNLFSADTENYSNSVHPYY